MSNVHTNFHSINDKLYQYWYHYWGPVAFIGDVRGMCHWNAFQNCTYEIVPNISGVNELRLSTCSSNSRCRLVQHSPDVQQVMGSTNLQLEINFHSIFHTLFGQSPIFTDFPIPSARNSTLNQFPNPPMRILDQFFYCCEFSTNL